jgi:hypothetical protein
MVFPIAQGFGARPTQGHTEEGEVFGFALAGLPIYLKPVSPPGPQEFPANLVSCFGKGPAVSVGLLNRECLPTLPLKGQAVGSESPHQHIIGRIVFGVQFQARALKPLYLITGSFDDLSSLRADGVAKDGQPSLLLPELADASLDAIAGCFGEAQRLAGQAGRDEQRKCRNQYHDSAGCQYCLKWSHNLLLVCFLFLLFLSTLV